MESERRLFSHPRRRFFARKRLVRTAGIFGVLNLTYFLFLEFLVESAPKNLEKTVSPHWRGSGGAIQVSFERENEFVGIIIGG